MSFLSCVRQLGERGTRACGLLALAGLLTSPQWSQAQTFPGEQDPVGGPNNVTSGSPERLILFPDDELAIISFSPVGSGMVPLWIQEWSPNPDYTVPTSPQNTSTAPNPWPVPQDEENIFSNAAVARGRFVDPNQDALVALTKVSTGAGLYDGCDPSATNCINWAVQEITFITPPTTPKPPTLPLFTFSAPVVSDTVNFKSFDSPGAIG